MYNDFKDYYRILQIAFTATEPEIKSAYRKMARESHPDLHPEDVAYYTGIFQEVTEAYETLSDPERKAMYDARYRSLVLREQPVYADYYDETPEDTRTYEHKYTARKKRSVNYYPIIAFAILAFQVIRMVMDTAPVTDSNYLRSRLQPPAPTTLELREMLRHTTVDTLPPGTETFMLRK